TAAEATRRADVVISSQADDQALRAVYLDDDGVCAGLRPGVVVADTSTVDPETSIAIGEQVDRTGAGFLDSPVSGSVSTVESGALTVMVGGDTDLLDRIRPVLDPIAARIIHIGPRGTGAAAKLAVNGLVHGLNVALSEALVLAERAGVDRATAYEVFAGGAGGAPFVHYKREAYEHPEEAQVAFSLDLVAKDLELITGLAERVGAPMAQARVGLETVRRAIDAGFGQADLSAIAEFLRKEQ
ncbi:MAG TPA: NAD(P)-dependent oxidoreductase, partial [Acidimicrobiia bacterium]|nr:NAD(P)-dependent oxidoreductase [Acidimicrobiia bacterium]